MAINLSLQQKMSQQLVMTPQLQQAIKLLQLNHLELATEVQREMESEHIQHALVESIDNLIARFGFPCPNYLKIDVDGCERLVVEGAGQTLKEDAMRSVLIETDEETLSEITAMMNRNGFVLSESHEIREITGSPVTGVKNYQFEKID